MSNGADDSSSAWAALSREPRPLLFGPGKLGIIWSAKSACTTVLFWYLWHCNLLRAARFYNGWPHRFRNDVLYGSETHRAWSAQAEAGGWRWLRIVRDPCKRAVSSYRHALRHNYEDAKIARVLKIDAQAGYSFEQFVDYLERIDVGACNLHHRAQTHPIEAVVKPSRIINVDRQDLMTCLGEIDATLEAPAEPRSELLAAIAEIAPHHHASRIAAAEIDRTATRFTRQDAWGEWPDYGCFLSAAIRDRLRRIYAQDFERYGDHV